MFKDKQVFVWMRMTETVVIAIVSMMKTKMTTMIMIMNGDHGSKPLTRSKCIHSSGPTFALQGRATLHTTANNKQMNTNNEQETTTATNNNKKDNQKKQQKEKKYSQTGKTGKKQHSTNRSP